MISTGSPYKYSDSGTASFYGEKVNGNHTASGEIFDYRAYSAASNSVKLGTFVEVSDSDNPNKSILTKVGYLKFRHRVTYG